MVLTGTLSPFNYECSAHSGLETHLKASCHSLRAEGSSDATTGDSRPCVRHHQSRVRKRHVIAAALHHHLLRFGEGWGSVPRSCPEEFECLSRFPRYTGVPPLVLQTAHILDLHAYSATVSGASLYHILRAPSRSSASANVLMVSTHFWRASLGGYRLLISKISSDVGTQNCAHEITRPVTALSRDAYCGVSWRNLYDW